MQYFPIVIPLTQYLSTFALSSVALCQRNAPMQCNWSALSLTFVFNPPTTTTLYHPPHYMGPPSVPHQHHVNPIFFASLWDLISNSIDLVFWFLTSLFIISVVAVKVLMLFWQVVSVLRSGALYQCPLSSYTEDCRQVSPSHTTSTILLWCLDFCR